MRRTRQPRCRARWQSYPPRTCCACRPWRDCGRGGCLAGSCGPTCCMRHWLARWTDRGSGRRACRCWRFWPRPSAPRSRRDGTAAAPRSPSRRGGRCGRRPRAGRCDRGECRRYPPATDAARRTDAERAHAAALTAEDGRGSVFRIDRLPEPGGYGATVVSGVVIYPCAGARTPCAGRRLSAALGEGGRGFVRSLRLDAHHHDGHCWLHGDGYCFSTRS
jgi:hypothetical protein